MKSIKTKLVLIIGLIIIIVCGSLSGIFMYNASKVLTDNTEKSLIELANAAVKIVENRITARDEELEILANMPMLKDLSIPWGEKVSWLHQEASQFKFTSIGIADLQGNFTTTDGRILNISTTEDFKSALNGSRGISDSYMVDGNDSLLFNFTVPIKNKNTLMGNVIKLV